MGTRGTIAFVDADNGVVTHIYNQFDSYLAGVGKQLLNTYSPLELKTVDLLNRFHYKNRENKNRFPVYTYENEKEYLESTLFKDYNYLYKNGSWYVSFWFDKSQLLKHGIQKFRNSKLPEQYYKLTQSFIDKITKALEDLNEREYQKLLIWKEGNKPVIKEKFKCYLQNVSQKLFIEISSQYSKKPTMDIDTNELADLFIADSMLCYGITQELDNIITELM